MGFGTHWPVCEWQISPPLQGLPSLQFLGAAAQPTPSSQKSSVQGMPSSQTTSV
jgi:hypothetical protein